MSFQTRSELLERLPSRRTGELQRAIGRVLLDMRRLVQLDLAGFQRMIPGAPDEDYFALSLGPVEFVFDGVTHRFAVWSEQLSIVVADVPIVSSDRATVISLHETPLAAPRLKACLGRRCDDVRIWAYLDDIDTDEAKEAAVSYVLGDEELVYGLYVHGQADDDRLVFAADAREHVASVFSLREQRVIFHA